MTPPSTYSAFLIAMAVSAARRILGKVLQPARVNPGKPRGYPGDSLRDPESLRYPVDLSLVRSSDSFSMYFASTRDTPSADCLSVFLRRYLPDGTYIRYEFDETPDEAFPKSGAATYPLDIDDFKPPLPTDQVDRFNRGLRKFQEAYGE